MARIGPLTSDVESNFATNYAAAGYFPNTVEAP